MCKSALYASNTGSQSVASGEPINFGSIVRRFGQNLTLSGGDVVAKGSGYYEIIANLTLVADTAGALEVAIYKDGRRIRGAVAGAQGSATIEYSLTIPAIEKIKCCCDSTFTVVPSADITLSNASITVKKI